MAAFWVTKAFIGASAHRFDHVRSYIGVHDTVEWDVDRRQPHHAVLVVALAGGDDPLRTTISAQMRCPDGSTQSLFHIDHFFNAPGVNVEINWDVTIPTEIEGVIWFEVFVNDDLVTRSPFRVVRRV